MLLPKKEMPKDFIVKKRNLSSDIEKYPFYIKECGYTNKKKLELGNEYSYSDILILYSIEGVFRYTKNASTKYIQQQHVVTSACNTTLTFTRSSPKWEYFYIIVNGSHCKLYYNLIRTKSELLTINPLTNLVDHFIDLIKSSNEENDLTFIEESLSIHHILTELYKITYDVGKAKTFTPVQESDVNTALKFIAKNYQKDLSLDIICQEVNLSKYYFCKTFTKHVGMSIHSYVSEYRVNKSKELLSYSKLSINAVAVEVGFKSTLTYIRAFKSSMHMTPSEYRKYF